MESYVLVPVTDCKQVRLLKLLYEGSIPLSKARIKLNDNAPKVIVDRLNQFFGEFISSIPGDWFRAEAKFLAGYGLDGRKQQVMWLDDNVEIVGFAPDKKNPRMVTLKVRRERPMPKVEINFGIKDQRRSDMIETSNSNSM